MNTTTAWIVNSVFTAAATYSACVLYSTLETVKVNSLVSTISPLVIVAVNTTATSEEPWVTVATLFVIKLTTAKK